MELTRRIRLVHVISFPTYPLFLGVAIGYPLSLQGDCYTPGARSSARAAAGAAADCDRLQQAQRGAGPGEAGNGAGAASAHCSGAASLY